MNVIKLLTSIFILLCLCSCSSKNDETPIHPNLSNLIQLENEANHNTDALLIEIKGQPYALFEQSPTLNSNRTQIAITNLASLHPTITNLRLENQSEQERSVTLVGNILLNNQPWLMLNVTDLSNGNTGLVKGRFSESGVLNEVETIAIDAELGPLSFPKLIMAGGDLSFIVFRHRKCCGLGIAVSRDHSNYKVIESQFTGFMPNAAVFNDGSLLFTYQRSFDTGKLKPNGKKHYVIKSRFRLSHDSANSWEAEHTVSDSVDEVHDAFPLQRKDGNIDLYYVHGLGRSGDQWSLWRRCVNSKAELGQEEFVIGPEVGDISKPFAFRQTDGKIALFFVDYSAGFEVGSRQFIATLDQDAACSL